MERVFSSWGKEWTRIFRLGWLLFGMAGGKKVFREVEEGRYGYLNELVKYKRIVLHAKKLNWKELRYG